VQNTCRTNYRKRDGRRGADTWAPQGFVPLIPQTRAGRGEDIDPWCTLFGTGMNFRVVRMQVTLQALGNGCLIGLVLHLCGEFFPMYYSKDALAEFLSFGLQVLLSCPPLTSPTSIIHPPTTTPRRAPFLPFSSSSLSSRACPQT
jgi:hypothetical protein